MKNKGRLLERLLNLDFVLSGAAFILLFPRLMRRREAEN